MTFLYFLNNKIQQTTGTTKFIAQYEKCKNKCIAVQTHTRLRLLLMGGTALFTDDFPLSVTYKYLAQLTCSSTAPMTRCYTKQDYSCPHSHQVIVWDYDTNSVWNLTENVSAKWSVGSIIMVDLHSMPFIALFGSMCSKYWTPIHACYYCNPRKLLNWISVSMINWEVFNSCKPT